MSPRLVLGVDPGALGGLAWVDELGDLIAIEDTPIVSMRSGRTMKNRIAVQAFAALVPSRRPAHAVIERVGSMPGQGVSSTFAFGFGAGLLEGALAGMLIPITAVVPQVWKREMKLASSDKNLSRQRAMQLWPASASLFSRVKDDGRAESALLALWGLRGGLLSVAVPTLGVAA